MGSHSALGELGLLIAVIGLMTALLQLKNAKPRAHMKPWLLA